MLTAIVWVIAVVAAICGILIFAAVCGRLNDRRAVDRIDTLSRRIAQRMDLDDHIGEC